MNPEEPQLLEEITRFDQIARSALEQKDRQRFRQAVLAQVEPLAKVTQLAAHDYNFTVAESRLERLRTIVQLLQPDAEQNEKKGLEARLLYTEAIFFDVRGTYNLFERLMLVEAPVELQQAQKRYERVVELSEQLGVDSPAGAGVQGMAQRIKGIRLFGQGRYHIEAADLRRANDELAESRKALEEAAAQLKPLAGQGSLGPESAMFHPYCTSLAAYADALRFRCAADGQAFAGRHEEAAHRLIQQFERMEAAKQALLGMTYKVSDTLAQRLAQEMDLCDKRQKFFAAEALKTQPRPSFTSGTILFVALMILTLVCQIVAFKVVGVQMNLAYYLVILAASLTVGGIGAGLASWAQGARFFQDTALSASKLPKVKASKSGKAKKSEQ